MGFIVGQIKFFPLKESKKLDAFEREHLKNIQDWINGARAGMNNRIASESKYWQAVERSLFHNKFKDKIRLVKDDTQN